jgi:hypothetical protein
MISESATSTTCQPLLPRTWEGIRQESPTDSIAPSVRHAEIKIVHHIGCKACVRDNSRRNDVAVVPQRLAGHQSEKVLESVSSHPRER